MTNPYKPLTGERPLLKRMTTEVSEEDYIELFIRGGMQKGFVDAVLATLVRRAVLAIKSQAVKTITHPEDHASILKELTRLVSESPLPPVNGHGCNSDV